MVSPATQNNGVKKYINIRREVFLLRNRVQVGMIRKGFPDAGKHKDKRKDKKRQRRERKKECVKEKREHQNLPGRR